MKFDRYAVSSEEDVEPNSNGAVLKNKLGIKTKNDMDVLEEAALEQAELALLASFDEDHQFTCDDICNMHKKWLGDIYYFAGKYRTVNMTKDDFPFAASEFIDKSMQKFEREYLAKYTPCHASDTHALAEALGIVHVEFIIIHPFREGNGRVSRLLADLMAAQARRPPLNYALIDQTENKLGFDSYIRAIHAGVVGDYQAITKIFKRLCEDSI